MKPANPTYYLWPQVLPGAWGLSTVYVKAIVSDSTGLVFNTAMQLIANDDVDATSLSLLKASVSAFEKIDYVAHIVTDYASAVTAVKAARGETC